MAVTWPRRRPLAEASDSMTLAIISHAVVFLGGLYVGARYGERLREIWYGILGR